jgi:hypothetical protein
MTIHFLPPELDRYEVAVEDAIATCNGDLRGAVKALLILNEHLEAELMELQAAISPRKQWRCALALQRICAAKIA